MDEKKGFMHSPTRLTSNSPLHIQLQHHLFFFLRTKLINMFNGHIKNQGQVIASKIKIQISFTFCLFFSFLLATKIFQFKFAWYFLFSSIINLLINICFIMIQNTSWKKPIALEMINILVSFKASSMLMEIYMTKIEKQ